MTWREYLPIASFVISVVSAFIAVVGFRRTIRLQRFDYAPRVQLSEETVMLGGVTREQGFSYRVILENPGAKTLHVDSVCVDYGSQGKASDRLKRHVEGEFYLPPGGKRAVSLSLAGKDILEVMRRFETDTCGFYLRVRIHTPEEGIVERTRALVATTESGGGTFFVPRGDILL